jgi:Domain of unknown function (DUF5655)
MWACPKCGRHFERKGQTHSCRVFPLEQHFEGKATGKFLYERLKQALEKRLGAFTVDSVECCIHFVHSSTFLAVEIFKDKIRVEFNLNRRMEHERIDKFVQMSANRALYFIDINAEDEIDETLMRWIEEAYSPKTESSKH